MAFNIRHLEAFGGQSRRGTSYQKYLYRTSDAAAVVSAAGYFDNIKSKLEVGDVIDAEYVSYESDGVTVATAKGRDHYRVAVKTDDILYIHPMSDESYELLVTKLDDISTAGTVTLTPEITGSILNITTVLGGPITVGDAAITFDIDGTAIVGSAITVANAGSAAGDTDTVFPAADRYARAATNVITMTTDGGSTGTQALYVVYELEQSNDAGAAYFNVLIDDISTAATVYVPTPVAGYVAKIYSVIDGTIGTADAVLTAEIDGVAITGGTITVANAGSAAGDVDSCTPTAANTAGVGSYISIATDGASTNAVKCQLTIQINR